MNKYNQKFFQNFPEVICGRIFMKLGPIKAELNEVFRSISQHVQLIQTKNDSRLSGIQFHIL
jgi:phage-related protein